MVIFSAASLVFLLTTRIYMLLAFVVAHDLTIWGALFSLKPFECTINLS
jgi:hypothetical protein